MLVDPMEAVVDKDTPLVLEWAGVHYRDISPEAATRTAVSSRAGSSLGIAKATVDVFGSIPAPVDGVYHGREMGPFNKETKLLEVNGLLNGVHMRSVKSALGNVPRVAGWNVPLKEGTKRHKVAYRSQEVVSDGKLWLRVVRMF